MRTIAILLLALCLVGCAARTEYGECIGVADDPEPGKVYKLSKRNIVIAFIFSESFVVPGWVILWRLRCPVAERRA